ncbi:hypothetical protein CDAR_591211 [Caerostris darwini]|uniref:Uncharacterized protein n=1 Tax=Caerostris darwini TaxID=1538125 RepID=A0AAV4RJC1_9ARAC|nr:hypothetical protein CDAR_591211 [Caerostris darwini]
MHLGSICTLAKGKRHFPQDFRKLPKPAIHQTLLITDRSTRNGCRPRKGLVLHGSIFNLAPRTSTRFSITLFFSSRLFGSLFSHGRKTLMKKGHIPKMNDALEKLESTSLVIPRLICTNHLRWRVRKNSCLEECLNVKQQLWRRIFAIILFCF